ncbi:MAG: SAM-dependent DNA methyltransferase, partial [Bacteroidia bacterium]|nr:SAM-dependent DNA methyltransferase [Bacteroidia bacterium]
LDISQLDRLETLTEDKLKLNEVESASFTLDENNAEDFYFWIDRFLFKEEKQKATLKIVEESFGYQSNVFIECLRKMSVHFHDIKKYGEVQVSFEQWKKFLSIVYGSFDASENNFIIHTYLSVFSKMLAYTVVSNDNYIGEDEMQGIIDGSIFHKYNIHNFIDNDFFYWLKNERSFKALKKIFRLIAQEISTYDFQDVEEDILKGVYQELIDLDTRHALGEYYTPDWLCERIVKEFNFKPTDKILDPACGSGSFLRAAIHRLKRLHPKISVEQLSENIFGIDIHPLSVQIAKTTLLLALGKEIVKSKKPVHLNIILANTLFAPEGAKNLFGFSHLEIAAIFLAHCSSYFLKAHGKLAFVLPRSFFSADHHDSTRSGKATGFRITNIWDLLNVSPLFRIPSGVFLVTKENEKNSLPASGLEEIDKLVKKIII